MQRRDLDSVSSWASSLRSITVTRTDSNLAALTRLLSWFDQIEHASVPYSTWLQAQLMLAEGFTNAVRHAQGHFVHPPAIEVAVSVLPDRLELRLWDQGAPFDLDRGLQALLERVGDDHLREQGRGLLLMYRMSDFLVYTRTAGDRNLLLLIKLYA